MTSLRSCRRFLDKNVDPNIVTSILTAMAAAPTGGNAMGVEYTVIDDKDRVNEIRKAAYGLMLDRLQLSIRNQWLDALNRVYIIYTVEDIMADLHCGNQKACKLLSELENKTGLIKRKRQGLGKPSQIYVLKFSTSCPQNDSESHFKTCENHTSGDVKTTSLDMWKSHGNNTDFNKPEYNKTNPIYPGQASA